MSLGQGAAVLGAALCVGWELRVLMGQGTGGGGAIEGKQREEGGRHGELVAQGLKGQSGMQGRRWVRSQAAAAAELAVARAAKQQTVWTPKACQCG